jgi:hypothetical protein
MPFIRGRYYVNPIAGGALEAAREAEEAAASSQNGDGADQQDDANAAAQPVEKRVFYDQGQLVNFLRDELAKNGTSR